MEVLHTFGIDWRLLFAQVVNFSVLLFVLHRFVYRPILKIMDERRAKIEQGLIDAEVARKILADASEQKEQILIEAQKQAHAHRLAIDNVLKKEREAILAAARNEASDIVTRARESAEKEREAIIKKTEKDLIKIVIAVTEVVLGEELKNTALAERVTTRALERVQNL